MNLFGWPRRWAPEHSFGLAAIWTVGGVMAIQELLRLVWAEDRLVLDRDALWRVRRRGPFTSTRALARNEIRRVFVQPANTALMVQLSSNLMELTDLGTPAERAEAGRRLCAAMELPDEGTSAEPAALPEDWQEAAGARGERLLVPNLQTRRQQAVAVAIVTGVVWTGLVLLARESLSEPNLWVVTLMLTVLGAWLARQTLWMFRGRKEWRIERGRLVHQRRFADEVTELCQARALELTESRDSDNDAWYHLHAIELSPSLPSRVPARRPRKSGLRTRSMTRPSHAAWAGGCRSRPVFRFTTACPPKPTNRPAPFLRTRFSERHPEFSPDGRRLAYASDESGRLEVYVRPFPGPGRPAQISTSGGMELCWSRDGREIFHSLRDPASGTMEYYAVPVESDGDDLRPGVPKRLFGGCRYRGSSPVRAYDVGPDGAFLLIKQDPDRRTRIREAVAPVSIELVQNWFEELRARVPVD
jgi:hypothetical protein